METRQETLWDKFLAPIFNQFLIDREALAKLRHSVDWEAVRDRFSQSDNIYPDYYLSHNFHGIKNGYLTPDAAVTYDPITQYVLPPNETWVRQEAVNRIQGSPRRILDLGCGTGSTTILLKQAFPQAEVIGVDLSPYMLFMASEKAKKVGLEIQWQQAKAEETPFKNASFDVVTASLLFHETPSVIAKLILKECFRLLTPGGQVIILDGNQKALFNTDWLTEIFEEPFIKEYAQGSVDAWMGNAGFEAVRTDELWWIHQVTRGMKPLPITEEIFSSVQVSFA